MDKHLSTVLDFKSTVGCASLAEGAAFGTLRRLDWVRKRPGITQHLCASLPSMRARKQHEFPWVRVEIYSSGDELVASVQDEGERRFDPDSLSWTKMCSQAMEVA